MKKKTVRLSAVIILILISLCSCGLTLIEPEEIVNDFFQGLKTKNEDTLILYTKNEDINMLLHSKGSDKALDRLYESLFKNFSYTILSTEKNKDETEAVVKAEVSNSDFSKVLKKYQEEAYTYMQENLYSGDLNKKKLNAKCLSIFADQVEKASEKKKSSTETISITLKKNDNYSWDMELTEEMMEIFMGGLIIPL